MPEGFHTLRLILGDQLHPGHSWFRTPEGDVLYAMMEVRQESDYTRHHIQKILAFFSAMRTFAEDLREQGHRVVYLALDDSQNTQSIPENLRSLVRQHGIRRFEYLLPDERRLDEQLASFCSGLDMPWQAVDTEHFLTGREDVRAFFQGKKQFRMETFYRRMRRKTGLLMEDGKPAGGRWNYDAENRGRYDGKARIPDPLAFQNDVAGLKAMIRREGVATMGWMEGDALLWPVTRAQALSLLEDFVDRGLPRFGTYQDAMVRDAWALFHSRLSFALNTKMLTPGEVLDRAVRAWEDRPEDIALSQVEGYVRQILGWREYMRGIYWALPELGEMNFFGHDQPLPHFYWDGNTRMACMARAIGQSLEYAYAHHIQRLMITGNFALLAGVHPDAVDGWYLGVYIDAVEWVEMPNTRGMSQFADGGLIASKPYVSSAKYIRKMSDYCDACSYDSKKRAGNGACPFNCLYWRFYEVHRTRLKANPRVGLVYRLWDRMLRNERCAIVTQADSYLKKIESL